MDPMKNFSLEKGSFFSQPERVFAAFLDQYRYSTLGVLAKGIIHNLNGSLQVFSMQMELLQKSLLQEGEKITPSLNVKMGQCLAQMEKLEAMVEVLLQKGVHDDQESPQPIRLNDLLEEELSLLQHNLFCKHHIKVTKSFLPRLPLLRGYRLDFSQSLWNLIQNAVEAMQESLDKELTVETNIGSGQVQVKIRDTGCGIPEEIKPHLFTPFTTTKGGKHHGLGLFLSRELLAPYGGSFSYFSREGETLFSVHLPTLLARGN